MRRSTSVWGPMLLISIYYLVTIFCAVWISNQFPQFERYMPIGGIEELAQRNADDFETVSMPASEVPLGSEESIKLAVAILCTLALMVPISWVYFVTTKDREVDRSFAHTIMVLPVIVAGIAAIVHGSLPLAFSLAGIVAAVRFRFTLDEPAQALYIFIAIAVGLAAGISAVGVASVVSIAFVYLTLALWKLDYGVDLNTRFFAFLTGRGRDDKDL